MDIWKWFIKEMDEKLTGDNLHLKFQVYDLFFFFLRYIFQYVECCFLAFYIISGAVFLLLCSFPG